MIRIAIMLFSICLACSTTSYTQVIWGVKGGVQGSYARIRKNDARLKSTLIPSLNFGLAAKVYFDERMAFTSGIQYSSRGYKTQPQTNTEPPKTYRFHYTELPLLVEIDFKHREKGIFLKVGPYLGLIIDGKEVYKDSSNTTIRRTPKIDFSGKEFNPFDAGFMSFLGYHFNKKFFAEVGFQLGGNMGNDIDYGPSIKQRVAIINVGYYFH